MKIAAVYGYGACLGPTMHKQTEGRCKQALVLYENRKVNKIALAASLEKNGISLGAQMKSFFESQGIGSSDLICEPKGINSVGETDTFFEISCRTGAEIIVVSTWYHIPRVQCLWWWRNKQVECIVSWKGTRLLDIILEPFKILHSVVWPFDNTSLSPDAKPDK